MDSIELSHHYTHVNGIQYHYASAGRGPLVVLLHGFPELWYSYRFQLPALAAAGYQAVAVDLRGFGESDGSDRVEDYSLVQHTSDVLALFDALRADQAVLVGHDWGANLTWAMTLLYPSRVKAVVALSIPFYPEPRDPAQIKRFATGHFNFMTYFQRPGAVEAEFLKDPQAFLRAFFYGLSGDAPAGTLDTLYRGKPENAKLLDGFPQPGKLPAWLGERDLDYYVAAFERTGISGALGFYRNLERDYPILRTAYQANQPVTQPVLFIGGAEEAAVKYGDLEPMRRSLPRLRRTLVLPGCGHWVQQERAHEVNDAILEFLHAEVGHRTDEPAARDSTKGATP